LPAALRREWLVTNGLGGFAAGTLAGANTRRYHGLLVAALTPPVSRVILVGGMVEWATYDGRRFPLSSHEYGEGVFEPHGYRHLESFRLDGALPVWTFALADALLERRVWMAYGANTTYVHYRLQRASRPVDLEIAPLITHRDFHSLEEGLRDPPAGDFRMRAADFRLTAPDEAGAPPLRLRLAADDGHLIPGRDWWWNFRYREETARGLDDHANLFNAGVFIATLVAGGTLTLVFTIEPDADLDGARALNAAQRRQTAFVRRVPTRSDPFGRQLVLAADQFLVKREPAASPRDRPADPGAADSRFTIIAGYPWFNDWGRDTMIALPGLTLSTGRPEAAADILRGFARYVRNGLLPNNFPDRAGTVPGYNTVDASLWYGVAVHRYHAATGDEDLVEELLPVLSQIADSHIEGTDFAIGTDPVDGLLRAGGPGLQLTWMDARVGDVPVTPRTGKPVEINALWYNFLRFLVGCLAARDPDRSERYAELAERCRVSFRKRFLDPERGYLADVVDGPEGDDWTLRPNQIFAVSLPFPLLEGAAAVPVLDAVGRALYTSYGLRSLAPDHPDYRGAYVGDVARRDGGYHQGPVWTWLAGGFAEAHFRVYGDAARARAFLAPFQDHLRDAGTGSISEILEGDPPHAPRGCFAQAWGVAEVLRVWRLLGENRLA
jgi:predicted glycogen debranching enzyme